MSLPTRQGLLSLALPDKATLYKSYMPFLKGGGLFVATAKPYKIHDEVFLLLTLPEEKERRPVSGRVAWLAQSPSGGRPQGVGVQFVDTAENEAVRSRIEVLLAGMSVDHPTHTM